MDTLEKELRDIGYSDDFINSVRDAKLFVPPDVDIANICFQSFENDIVSSTELKITDAPTSYTNYVIGTESDE